METCLVLLGLLYYVWSNNKDHTTRHVTPLRDNMKNSSDPLRAQVLLICGRLQQNASSDNIWNTVAGKTNKAWVQERPVLTGNHTKHQACYHPVPRFIESHELTPINVYNARTLPRREDTRGTCGPP